MKTLHWTNRPFGLWGTGSPSSCYRFSFIFLFLIAGTFNSPLSAAEDMQIACLSSLNVTLDENCGRQISPDMILTGDYSAADLIEISIDGQATDYLSGCGLHTYTVEVYENGELTLECWGNILAEDKTPPLLTCPEGTNEAVLLNDMQILTGALSAQDSPSFDPSNYGCYLEVEPPLEAGQRYYHTHTFSISNSDIFTFIPTANYNGLIGLYQGAFSPENPCQNLIAQSDDTFIGSIDEFDPIVPDITPSLRLSLSLQINKTYTLVWTSSEPLAEGDYGIAIFSDADGRVLNLTKSQVQLAAELVCLDVEDVWLPHSYTYAIHPNGDLVLDYDDPYRIPQEIRHVLAFTGYPLATDNCSAMLVTVYDEITEEGDCGNWIITRHFIVQDRYQSDCEGPALVSSCSQVIIVRKPNLGDLVLPPFTSILECDEGFPTDGNTGGPDDNPAPEYTGYPYLSTALNFYDLNQSVCNLGASYSDEPRVVDCPGSYYFRREWTIIDWCAPGNLVIFDQIIRVGDFTGPVITFEIPDYDHDGEADLAYQYSTSPLSCMAVIPVPTPTVFDGNGCAGIQSTIAQINDQDGQFVWSGQPLSIVQLPIGDYTLILCAVDECGNENCEEVPLLVRDRIAPTAVCVEEIIVSLGGGDSSNGSFGTAFLTAEDIDEGSSDQCSEVSIAIRRDEQAPWTDEVHFSCEDIGDTISVFLLVTDTAQNSNTCWINIVPEDKLKPICYPPENAELSCTEFPLVFSGNIEIAYLNDFVATSITMNELFGGASGTDNCRVDTIVERSPNIQMNECGWGVITRRFEAWQMRPAGDVNGNGAIDISEVFRSTNNCSQTITITEIHNFKIDFPEDTAANCDEPEVPTIITTADGCDVLSINISEPMRFDATGDECYKYALTYDVINWCLWDGEYEGYILPRLTEDDGGSLPIDHAVEGNERPVVCYNDTDGLCIDRRHTDRNGNSQLDNCFVPTDLPNFGRWIYTQFIKVYDTTAPVIAVGEYGGPTDLCPELEPGQFGDVTGNCEAAVSIPFSVADACELFDNEGNLVVTIVSADIDLFSVDANGDGLIKSNEFVSDGDATAYITNEGNGIFSFDGTFPIITAAMGDNIVHAFRVLFEDGCGNQVSQYMEFDVIDCKGPAPICINGLTVTLMPQEDGSCAMSIWASDFEGSPIYDCTGQGPETNGNHQRVSKYAIYRASDVDANPGFAPNPDDTGLLLTDADDETTVVYVYAFDEEGNYDYCETYVLLQSQQACSSGPNATIAGLIATEDDEAIAGVEVSISGDQAQSTVTAADGVYAFSSLAPGSDVSINPYLNVDPLNGVSTFDLILISKHILGVQPISSPYSLIAADVNNSQSITTLDLIHIRKLILNITTEFPNNTSWRFVDADYNFPQSENPWSAFFPELININNIEQENLADFVGIKVGDVNGSAQAHANAGENRSMKSVLYLEAADIAMKAGEIYTIPFTAEDIALLDGFQTSLRLQGIELVAVTYGALKENNFGLRQLDEGHLTISWDRVNGEAGSQNRDATLPLPTANHLFSLVIRAKADHQLHDAISISSRYTRAEAYRLSELAELKILFHNPTKERLRVHQNRPNPFTGITNIDFDLPDACEVNLKVNDINGRVIYRHSKEYSAGPNSIHLAADALNGYTGVLYYTLATNDYSVTRKMVALENK